MRPRIASALFGLLIAATALAQQSNPPTPKVVTPTAWPWGGYAVAAILFAIAIFLSLKSTTRSEVEETGA
jgi:hypothetical protein